MAIKKDIIGAEVQIGTNEAQASLSKLSKTTADLTKANEALRIERAKLVSQGKKNTDEYKKLGNEITNNNKKIRANKEQMQALSKTIGVTSMSANQLTKRARELKAQMNGLSKSANPDEWNRLNKELGETTTQLDKVKAGTQKTGGFLGKLKGAAGGLLPAFGWAAIISGAIAAGKAIYDLAKQTQAYRQQVQKLTDLSGKELADTTAMMVASTQTFKTEFDELLIANNSMAKAFDLTNQEAQKLIDEGFLEGADATGEFLDQVKEYSPQFKAAGLSAKESIAIITQSVKSGIFSDKGADAVKEATIRLREMTPATQKALAAIGISSVEIQKKLRDGTMTYGEAIGKVSEQLGKFPEQSIEVGTALADIFGGPGEDAGIAYIKTLKDIGKGLDGVQDETNQTATAQQKLLEANNKIQKAWSDLLGTGTSTFTNIGASIKLFAADALVSVVDGLKDIRDWFITAYNDSAPFRGVVQTFFLIFNQLIDTTIFNLSLIWKSIKSGVKLFLALFTFDKEKISQAWEEVSTDFSNSFKKFGKESAENFANAYNETLKGRIEPVIQEAETKKKTTTTQVVEAVSGTSTGEAFKSPADKLKEETEKLQEAQLERENVLKEQRANDLISQQEFDALMLEQKTLALQEEKMILEQFGQDTAIIEGEILDSKIDRLNKEAQASEAAEKLKKKEREKNTKDELKLEKIRIKAREDSLDSIISITGKESAAGKAALLIKQGLALSEAAMALGIGMSNTASIGFPQNIPALIAFGAQAIGIISTITSAVGKKSGGFTDAATNDDKITDFVHSNEFVANAKAVRNPTVLPILNTIDAAQKNGTIESINLPNAISSQSSMGTSSAGTSAVSQSDEYSNAQMQSSIDKLALVAERLLNEPIIAALDYDNFTRDSEKMDKLKQDVAF